MLLSKCILFHKEGEEVLEDFNLEVKRGESIVWWAKWSGKSTIVNLLCRFYEPVKVRFNRW